MAFPEGISQAPFPGEGSPLPDRRPRPAPPPPASWPRRPPPLPPGKAHAAGLPASGYGRGRVRAVIAAICSLPYPAPPPGGGAGARAARLSDARARRPGAGARSASRGPRGPTAGGPESAPASSLGQGLRGPSWRHTALQVSGSAPRRVGTPEGSRGPARLNSRTRRPHGSVPNAGAGTLTHRSLCARDAVTVGGWGGPKGLRCPDIPPTELMAHSSPQVSPRDAKRPSDTRGRAEIPPSYSSLVGSPGRSFEPRSPQSLFPRAQKPDPQYLPLR